MKDLQEDYEDRLCTAEQAIKLIHSGDLVVVGQAAAIPHEILDAMIQHADDFSQVGIYHILNLSAAPYCEPRYKDNFRHITTFVSASARAAVNEGRADYVPANFSTVPGLMATTLKPDVTVVQLSPPDENGFCTLGTSCDYLPAALKNTSRAIGLINDKMIRTFGDTLVHISQLDAIVETSRPIDTLPVTKIGPVEKEIGRYCASLVNDRDTLQLGIGAIPDAVLSFLKDKKDLGIHTEMISDGVVELSRLGVITNRYKTIDQGKMVVSFLMGSPEFYAFADNNPDLIMRTVDYTNDPYVIAQLDNMVSINSCIQVDLTGQVVSESIGPNQYSGVGGQADFVRGAALSKGGRSIITMSSTAAKGTISRIVAQLDPGARVTTSRNDVDYVVTEYGIAHLKGHTERHRAKSLIEISHPDFRPQLCEQYRSMFGESL